MSDHIKAAFEHRLPKRIPRGEFWIESRVFAERQVEDTIYSHVALCQEMEMDFVSIPVTLSEGSVFGYRMFSPSEIKGVAESGFFAMAVVDGPFQMLVNRRGLRQALTDIAGRIDEISETVSNEAQKVGSLVDTCIHYGANAVMIAEDIAYGRGTFFNPATFRSLLYPVYRELINTIHKYGACVVYHSCGDITGVIPDLVSLGVNGLSCQTECMDLLSLKRDYGAKLTLFTGVSQELLDGMAIPSRHKQQFGKIVTKLEEGGGFVLSSSSGLGSSHMVSNLLQLYGIADKT
jgi:Uroporphyrinogen decarboxylase (URO-D)